MVKKKTMRNVLGGMDISMMGVARGERARTKESWYLRHSGPRWEGTDCLQRLTAGRFPAEHGIQWMRYTKSGGRGWSSEPDWVSVVKWQDEAKDVEHANKRPGLFPFYQQSR